MQTITKQLSNGNSIKYQITDSGTYYHFETPAALVAILERFRESGERIRIYSGDAKTGKPWGDVETGHLGRSTGAIKVPLLIHSRRSSGGGALLDHCIAKIEYANKKRGGIIYQAKA